MAFKAGPAHNASIIELRPDICAFYVADHELDYVSNSLMKGGGVISNNQQTSITITQEAVEKAPNPEPKKPRYPPPEPPTSATTYYLIPLPQNQPAIQTRG